MRIELSIEEARAASMAIENFLMGIEDQDEATLSEIDRNRAHYLTLAQRRIDQALGKARRAARRPDPIERMELEHANVWNPAEHGEG